jgi:outer membrane biogenesis lipoprotein LolB
MDILKLLGALTLIGLLAACASPEEKAADAQAAQAKAQEQIAKQRLDLVAKYQTCVKDAGADQQKVAACDSFLKAAQALN